MVQSKTHCFHEPDLDLDLKDRSGNEDNNFCRLLLCEAAASLVSVASVEPCDCWPLDMEAVLSGVAAISAFSEVFSEMSFLLADRYEALSLGLCLTGGKPLTNLPTRSCHHV